jgi:hypothetical protein
MKCTITLKKKEMGNIFDDVDDIIKNQIRIEKALDKALEDLTDSENKNLYKSKMKIVWKKKK